MGARTPNRTKMPRHSIEQIETIDRTSLRILSEVGIRVDDEALCRRAVASGARAGRTPDRICLPPEMVREYVSMAPRQARFADCRGQLTSLGPGTRPTFWTGAALNRVAGTEARPLREDDLTEFTQIADALPNVFAVVGTSIEEIPPAVRDVVGFRILAENSTKHLRPLLFSEEGVRPILEMAQVIAGGRSLRECPLVSFGYSCLSPLHWPRIAVELWRRSAGHELPVMLNGEPVAGATSPVTLAGSIALSNAEILGGIALVELLEPGRPVVHNLGFAHTLDMRTAVCLSGAPECALMACAGAQLAAYYGLPSASWMGTDALLDDEQASLEKVLTGLAHALAGVNIIWGMGQLESQKSISQVQLVIDDAVAGALLRLWDGMAVDEETLAFDAVREVVESGGDFLSHEHTLEHYRELSTSEILSRTQRKTGPDGGLTRLVERAEARAGELLDQSRAPSLTGEQSRELDAIERRALERCRRG